MSDSRFEPFLVAKSGDLQAAEELYRWQAALSGEAMRTLHLFEVLLRNVVDQHLAGGASDTEPSQQSWLFSAQLSDACLNKARLTRNDVLRQGQPDERRVVLSRLSFSYWRSLFAAANEGLWRSTLSGAFPHAGLRREVQKPVERVHLWRNRIAHHDCLLEQRTDLRVVDMVSVAARVSDGARDFIRDSTDLLALYQARP